MIKENEYCSQVTETEINKLLAMAKKDHAEVLLNVGFFKKHLKKVT